MQFYQELRLHLNIPILFLKITWLREHIRTTIAYKAYKCLKSDPITTYGLD